jgi:hypothetical protein
VPPRYVYWTIIVDGQPTAFRSGSLEDIMPTFNRLKEKQPSAELKWFQHGKLWPSRHDAQDFMRARGDRGRERDPRQGGDQGSGTRDQGTDRPERAWNAKPDWKTRSTFKPRGDKPAFSGAPEGKPAWVPKGASPKPQAPSPGEKPEWKPKGSFTPAARRDDDKPSFAKATEGKPAWKSKSFSSPKPRDSSRSFDDRPAGQARGSKPEWKPKGTFKPKEAGHSDGWGEKPGWKSKGDKPAWKGSSSPKPSTSAKPSARQALGEKPGWKPRGTFTPKEDGHKPSARDQARSSFRPKSYTPKEDDGRTRASRVQSRNDKLDWKPASAKASTFAKAPADRSARQAPAERRGDGPNGGFAKSDPDAPKRKWVPKEEYKKSMGIEVKRDDKWRPGGVHRDPKQKYKDAKKAKWGRFKEAIRSRSTKPKKRDE